MRQKKDQVCLCVSRIIKPTSTRNVIVALSSDSFVILALEKARLAIRRVVSGLLYLLKISYLVGTIVVVHL